MGYKINNEETKVIDDIMNRLNEVGLSFELPEDNEEETENKEEQSE